MRKGHCLLVLLIVVFLVIPAPSVKAEPSGPTIDPTYAWHTFYGSSDYEEGYGIVRDGSGNVYVTGSSRTSWSGPAGQNPLHAHSGFDDMFVLKLGSSGAYQWHTFYGSEEGGGWNSGYAIATDRIGNVYVTGCSYVTWNGPAGQNPLHTHSGGRNIFVQKLDSTGAYQWHTFYGSGIYDDGESIATDGSGNVYVTGPSEATWDGPAGQNPLHAHSGASYYDMFVLKLDSTGAYQWHTFHGSSSSDEGFEIATDSGGNVYATGYSSATWNGPAGESPLHAHSGGSCDDIFVLKLDSTGAYQWHTFYGPSAEGYGAVTEGNAIATDGSGNVYVTGFSSTAWDGPAGQSPLHAHSGIADMFVLKLNSSGAYQWHTFYGRSSEGYGIATDGSGNVYVTGYSRATWNGPLGQSSLHAHSGIGEDIFVLKLNSSGAYHWHTFYGSSDWDYSYGIATDESGNVYVTGYSRATWNGPAGQSPLHTHTGSNDIVVLKLSDAPVSCDFDGDGKTDIAFYRSSTGVWWITPSSGIPAYGQGWGGPGFKPVPGNYDGDRKTDVAVYETSTGAWWIVPSSGTPAYGVGWGGAAFTPMPGDYDGDGKTDVAVYETSTGIWWIVPSSATSAYGVGWDGDASDKPVPSDYDGDGKVDVAIYRASDGGWYIVPSSGTGPQGQVGAYGVGWGGSDFKPVPGDYDGDGKTDIAIYHSSTGGWWVIPSSGTGPQGQVGAYGVGWGGSEFTPVPGDYDGDSKTDVAVYQSSNGGWWIIHSSDGSTYGTGWGGDASDIPLTSLSMD